MAYNVEKLAKLGALKELGLKQKAVDEAQNKRIKALEDVGAQANVLEGVKVNGVALAIAEKICFHAGTASSGQNARPGAL